MSLISRSIVFRLLRWLRGGYGRRPDLGRPLNILVFQHERIGDYFVATPMYQWLFDQLPNARIDVIASDLNAELIAMDPLVNDHCVISSRRGWRSEVWNAVQFLRRRRYDLILVTTFTERTRNAMLCVLAKGRPWCATFADRERAGQYAEFFDSVTVRHRLKEHVAVSIMRTAMEALGDQSEPMPHPYVIKTGTPAPYIAINVETRDPRRDWSRADAEWVGDALRQRYPDLDVIIGWRGTLTEMVSFYANARLVITANSAPAHVAAGGKVPVVVLYDTEENASEWFPVGGVAFRALLPDAGMPASAIDRERVLSAAVELLEMPPERR